MKRLSITKYNKFFIGGLMLYVVPVVLVTLITVNVIGDDLPKGPYDPSKENVQPVLFESVVPEPKKELKKKPKTLTSEMTPQKKVEVTPKIVVTPTIDVNPQTDSISN